MPGEEAVIGPHVLESPVVTGDPALSNRSLLLECCIGCGLMVANTYFDVSDDCKVTYRTPTTKPMDLISSTGFAQIDHILCQQAVWHLIKACSTSRLDVLNTRHFVTMLDIHLRFETGLAKQRHRLIDLSSFRLPDMCQKFVQDFLQNSSESLLHTEDLNSHAEAVSTALQHASAELPKLRVTKRRPWITAWTTNLIESRNAHRQSGNHEAEKVLNKQIRQAARADRRAWLLDELKGGTWKAVRKLKQGERTNHASVRNLQGELMPTSERADTLAEYFEKVQWQDRFPNVWLESSEPLGPPLPVKTSEITMEELKLALRKLSAGKAAGPDNIPPDFWKHLKYDEDARGELLGLCQRCWCEKALPDSWRRANIVLLFKKGDASLPANYQPIALLPVGYKVLASILFRRLVQGGAEERMRGSQYGFRPERGTSDALMVVRRMIDAAHQSSTGSLHLLMLDWAKAFDRVKPASLCRALLRFGFPADMCDMISAIYSERYFSIMDHTGQSSVRRQMTGIAQGCPLSPYLFIAVQTVMLHDVYKGIDLETEPPFVVSRDVLYADDTLLVSKHLGNLQALLDRIVSEGQRYGLELNWDKTLHMKIRSAEDFPTPDGGVIKSVRQAVYLGGLISCDGRATAEVTRRLGEGSQIFAKLERVWKHASISSARKIELYEACVVTKVMYSLETLWLLKADRCRLDAFHHRYLRRILGIQHSYYSRVTNASVLQQAGSCLLSTRLLQRQKKLYERIGQLPDESFVKRLVCDENGQPILWATSRGRGRPRQQWAQSVYNSM